MLSPSFKSICLRFVIPLTIVSFFSITKWWYAMPVDGVDTLYWGFPLPYVGEGWHTSGSLQFFVLEGLFDFLLYFVISSFVVSGIRKWMPVWIESKVAFRTIWTIASVYIMSAGFILMISNPLIKLKRPYDWQIMDSGLHFFWKQTPRPDIQVNHP